MPLHVLANFGGFLCECGLYISPINLLKASLVYGYHNGPILLSVSIRTAGRKLKHDGPNKTISRDNVSIRTGRKLKHDGTNKSITRGKSH
eukprot:Em0501g3a